MATLTKKQIPPAPAADGAAEKKKRMLWATGVFLGFAVLFGASRDRIYYFDGLLQAGMVTRPLSANPPDITFEWNHFLWYPTGRLFYLGAHAVAGAEGYESLQALNALIGAAGAALFFLILSRLAPFPWAALWTALACLGQVWWYRSAGAENHLAGGLWCLAQMWFLLEYWEEPDAKPLAGLVATGLLAAYFHLGNFACWGVAGLAVLLRRPKGKTAVQAASVAATTFLGWLPYALVHHWMEPGGFSKWWTWATSLAHGHAPGSDSRSIHWDLLRQGLLTAQTFVKSFLFFDEWGWSAALRLAVIAAAAGFAVLWRRPAAEPADSRGKIFLIPFAAFAGLYAVWMPGNFRYWIVPWAALCLALGAYSARRRLPGHFAALGLAALVLGQNNLSKVILPNKTNPDAFLVDMCREIGRVTPPESPIVIAGTGEVNLKPYIPYFGKRNRLAVDLFALNAIDQGNQDPIGWLSGTIAQYLRAGVPVYMTDDLIRAKDLFGEWKLPPERVESLWRPFLRIPVRDFPGPRPNRLYLLWTPQLPPDVEMVYLLRLKQSGLRDQMLLAARARVAMTPPAGRAEAARRLANITGLALAPGPDPQKNMETAPAPR